MIGTLITKSYTRILEYFIIELFYLSFECHVYNHNCRYACDYKKIYFKIILNNFVRKYIYTTIEIIHIK